MSQLVYCHFCEQEFFATLRDECPLCRKIGGLKPVEIVEATEDSASCPADVGATVPVPAEQSVFRSVRWSWWHLLVGMLGLAVPYAMSWLSRGGLLPRTIEVYWTAAGLSCAWCLAFPLWLIRRADPSKNTLLPRPRRILVELGWAIPVSIGIGLLLLVMEMLMYWLLGEASVAYDATAGLRRQPTVSPALLATIILGSTLFPLAEEVFFRGMVYNLLRQRWYILPAIASQALLFAVLHHRPLVNLLDLFIVGVCLALVYEWRRTLWGPALVHVTLNSVAFGYVLIVVIGNANAAFLGVACEDRPGETGCVVRQVIPGGPAEQGGLQVGDVIVGFDGEGIWNYGHLMDLIRSRDVGDSVTIQFYRGAALMEIRATLQRRPSQ